MLLVLVCLVSLVPAAGITTEVLLDDPKVDLYDCKVTLEVEKGRRRHGGYGERGNFGRILS